MTLLTDRLPGGGDPDELLEGFVAWTAEHGLDLYPAQGLGLQAREYP